MADEGEEGTETPAETAADAPAQTSADAPADETAEEAPAEPEAEAPPEVPEEPVSKMRYAKLFKPVSDDDPCGPDLSATYDEDYEMYYFEAIERIPSRFYDAKTGEPFDRKNIDIKAEVKEISGFLERSRDIRLLVMEAQFQILCGNVTEFSECLQTIDGLMQRFYMDVNPKIEAGDASERRTQLELLDEVSSVVMPLEYAPLFRDRRIDWISYRDYAVGTGKKEPREGEEPMDGGTIMVAMRSADNAEDVDKLHTDLDAARKAVTNIINHSRTAQSAPYSPSMGNLEEQLDLMLAFVHEARPDLASDQLSADGAEGEDGAEGDFADGEAGGGTTTRTITIQTGPVGSHGQAREALTAVQSYFARFEPSSPGLILIAQALHLIGRPLTEALDTLLPGHSENARIDFGSETGFMMDINRMRMLAQEAAAQAAAEEPPVEPMTAESREEASALITAVESFFRQTEPSSPLPILLFKAKTYLNRDFSAILGDLFQHLEK